MKNRNKKFKSEEKEEQRCEIQYYFLFTLIACISHVRIAQFECFAFSAFCIIYEIIEMYRNSIRMSGKVTHKLRSFPTYLE